MTPMGKNAPKEPPAGLGAGQSENETRLVSIIQSAMDAIITVDESQRIIMFNPAAERIFSVPAADAIGSPIDRFIPERFRGRHAEHIRGFGRTGVSMRAMGRLGTISGVRGDGSEFPIEASVSQSVVGGRRLYTVILRDITQRRQLEEQLLQAQKMEGIGRLAGGIAHDFNNMLMAVFNYLKLADNRLEPDHPARPSLANVHEAASRAATLTRQLLLFARKQPPQPRVLDPVEVLRGVAPMLRRLIGDNIELRTELSPDTGRVLADPVQIEQVLMNLVVNARDAMPEGGTITISVANIQLDDQGSPGHAEAQSGPYIVITVTDTGHGMTPEVLDRIFEPFFTTKDPDKGTGLGLATCHGIVGQSGGTITVESAPGRGTSIRVLLPRVADQPAPSAAPGPPARGTETVLLAEGSDVVRDLIAAALRDAGYTALAASSGQQALRLLHSHIGPVHLLLADLTMPGLSGEQLAAAVRNISGPLRVLYLSGGPDGHARIEHDGAGVEVLSKPLTTATVLERVRALLDAPTRQ